MCEATARGLVQYDDVVIDVIRNGTTAGVLGTLVLLPSSSRDSEDFDAIAAMFAASGFHVLRPSPPTIRSSCGA